MLLSFVSLYYAGVDDIPNVVVGKKKIEKKKRKKNIRLGRSMPTIENRQTGSVWTTDTVFSFSKL